MNKYILFLVFGISGTISYAMNQDEARELEERKLQDKHFRALADARFNMEQARRYGNLKKAKKFQKEYYRIAEDGWENWEKKRSDCTIL